MPKISLSTIAHKIFERRAKTSLKQLSTLFFEKKIREPNTQNILIYDPYVEGHHALYTLELTKKIVAENWRVVLLTPRQNEIEKRAREAGVRLEDVTIIEKENHSISRIFGNAYWMSQKGEEVAAYNFWLNALKTGADAFNSKKFFIFLPFIDVFIPATFNSDFLNRFPDVTFGGLYFHPKFTRISHLPVPPLIRSKQCRHLWVLDKNVIQDIQKQTSANVLHMPDFADLSLPNEVSSAAAELKDMIGDRPVVSLLGSLERRKGLINFLKLALDPQFEDVFFLCVGQLASSEFSADELKWIEGFEDRRGKNMYVNTGEYIETEAELNYLIKLTDVKVLAYQNFFHSSNFLTKCAAFNVPVIVNSGSYMAEVVAEYNLGQVCENHDYKSLATCIMAILAQPPYQKNKATEFVFSMSIKNMSVPNHLDQTIQFE